jgi:molybdopterin-guanine dinucleotide biosynthesis protein A
MEVFDAVVLAAGRLAAHEARSAGVELKAIARVGKSTPLHAIVGALRASRPVARVIVVGPGDLHGTLHEVDVWVDERASGEENVLAGLRNAHTPRAIVTASDAPFVEATHVNDFLSRVPADADFAYPVFSSEEFLSAFPQGRSTFARVGSTLWTGGSLCIMNVALALRHAPLIRRGFRARKSQLAMASLLGVEGVLRYVTGRLDIQDIEQRIGRLTGGRAAAIRGAHPALAMDCDSARDIAYARTWASSNVLHEER